MIEKIIRALQTTGLSTREDFANLEDGDVLKLKFRDEKEFQALLGMHIFESANEADLVEFQNGLIPILGKVEFQTNISTNDSASLLNLPPEKPSISEAENVLENSIQPSIATSSRNKRSRCPQCGRVKAKDAEFCKNCTPSKEDN